MDELRILIARLGWPSTSVRWWAMQELAARLGEPAARAETEVALLQLLRSRKLEAEVVEVLCIFWMAVQGHGYSPAAEVAKSIPKPSLLSGMLMASLGLSVHLDAFWTREQMLPSAVAEPISTTTIVVPPTLEQLMDEDSKAWPLAGMLDYNRMGYLQHDLYPSRLFFPTVPGLREVEVTPRDGRLEVKVEDHVVADLCYWNAGWGPARPRLLRGNCGTALISRGTAYREGAGPECGPQRAFYLWQVRTLHRSSSFGEFSETLASGVVFL